MIFEMSVGIDGFSRVGSTYLSIRGHVHREAPPVRSDAPAVVQSVRRTHPQTFKYRPQIGPTNSFIRQRGLVALSMKLSEYQDLYRRLSTAEDIDFLAENFGHDKELLLVIYTQRVVRETTKKFYRVKAQARRLAFMWQNGSSLLEIARKATFGDPYEIRRHLRKQLQPYSDMFGDGAVVYWFGHVDDQKYELPEGVDIVSPTFFETPPLPFPYVPVGEAQVKEPSIESNGFAL